MEQHSIFRHITLLIGLLFAGTSLLAQQEAELTYERTPGGLVRCASTQLEQLQHQDHPDMESREEFEAWLQQKIVERERDPQSQRAVVTLPVIVHILHDGQNVGNGINISAAQVNSQIEVLNEDYRRLPGTNGFNTDSVGADTEIEFCLANRDPNGNILAERGIHRIHLDSIGVTSSPPFSINFIRSNIQSRTIWDPNSYLNMWVVPISNGILGFASLPVSSGLPGLNGNANANTDGVVIAPIYFGRVGTASSPFDLGRTATHEIGHFLGLRHIWGDGNCNADDFCGDTPNADGPNYGCPNSNSCGSADMVENYMDYSNDACFNIFTQDQKTRMLTVLANSPRRKELLNSQVCVTATVAPTAFFGVVDTFDCNGTIQFADSSIDLPSSWFWTFGDGGTSTQTNPSHTYASSGTYTVTLVVNNTFGTNVFSQSVNVVVGNPPAINAGPNLNACLGDTVQLNIATTDSSAPVQWSPTAGLSNPRILNPTFRAITSRTYIIQVTDSLGCINRDTISIQVNPFPIIDAGADVTLNAPDTSVVLMATGNNIVSWDWSPTYGLITPPDSAVQISVPKQTVTYTLKGVDANGCESEDQVTVTVPGTFPLSIDFESELGVLNRPYPNPGETLMHFSARFHKGGNLVLNLYDLQGRRIDQVYNGQVAPGDFQIRWQRRADIPSGLYLLAWEIGGGRQTQKIQLR